MKSVVSIHNLKANPLRELVEETMQQLLDDAAGTASRGLPSAGLYRELSDYVMRPAKRVRPLVFLHGCAAFREDCDLRDPDLLRVACALEFLHAFILIHDDLIDNADERRGLPSLHRAVETRHVHGPHKAQTARNLSLVLGDILFAMAQRTVLAAHLPCELRVALADSLLETTIATGIGECADISFATRDIAKVGLREIEGMYDAKTARYTFESPLVLAAIAMGAGPEACDAIRRIARPIGLAFQIQNDLAEFHAQDAFESALCGDIAEGKKTLLLRLAYDSLNETERGIMQLCVSVRPPTEAVVLRLRELILRSGAPKRLAERMSALYEETNRELASSGLSSSTIAGLKSLFETIRKLLEGATHCAMPR